MFRITDRMTRERAARTRNRLSTFTILALFASACAMELEGEADADAPVQSLDQALQHDPARVPLVSFFSAERGDYFTTTQSGWVCRVYRTCAQYPGYVALGIQGYVYRPDRPQPAGTLPLYHWWNPQVADNFLTTDSRWSGRVGDVKQGYTLFRIEGYIPSSASTGSVPLVSFWNSVERDNAAINSVRVRMPRGWTSYRTEGHLLGPNSSVERRCQQRQASDWQDPAAWRAPANFNNNEWRGSDGFEDGDVLRIRTTGFSIINHWGARKSVSGEGIAPADWPAPGEPQFVSLGRVTTGRVWVPRKGSYSAGQWFPIGGGTDCIVYDARGVQPGKLHISINDPKLGDNRQGPDVTVTQWHD